MFLELDYVYDFESWFPFLPKGQKYGDRSVVGNPHLVTAGRPTAECAVCALGSGIRDVWFVIVTQRLVREAHASWSVRVYYTVNTLVIFGDYPLLKRVQQCATDRFYIWDHVYLSDEIKFSFSIPLFSPFI